MVVCDPAMTAAYRVVTAERNDLVIVTVVCDECGPSIALKIETAKVNGRVDVEQQSQ